MKKGNLVLSFVVLVIGVLLVGSLLIPTAKDSYSSFSTSDTFNRTNSSLNQTKTLANTNVKDFTSVTNGSYTLTYGTNFTEADGVVTFLADKSDATVYTLTYTYYKVSWTPTTSELALFSVVVLGAIIGIVYACFSMFGLTGGRD